MSAATFADIARIRAEIEERNRKEGALFDEWWTANKWRLPIRGYYWTEASEMMSFGPHMEAQHRLEFNEFCRERGLS